ncbi:disease resistance protein RUN1 [Cryptomeria japonica]|uniref:disease resistance protein RUN1 n=1 Tax=Cryptomeria japonica TaxID=3369 RepID=UPI0027DA00B8|nr:disease resistance protein RUN1 [Cryptomeria japonica]
MLKTPGLIIPLFYHVDPTHVRYPLKERSPYRQAFDRHYRHLDRYPKVEIDGWKNALEQICSRSGWSTDLTQGYETKLVKMVVTDLVKTLDRVPLEVAKHPVGLESAMNSVVEKLKLSSVEEVIKVGIWGIGGIGKTTIAKAVYNHLYIDFEAPCFVFNVQAAVDLKGLINLQKKVLQDLFNYSEKVDSIEKGKSLFRDRWGGKRVLLILDDVDSPEQLNALVGDWLAPGSRVVITSRDQHIFNVAVAECIHEMTGLEKSESLQLFNWHAFQGTSPDPTHKDLSDRIVDACKGHPLSLEEIGSFLQDEKNRSYWKEAPHNIPHNANIHKKLYISYNGLTNVEKEIFVDIACFFIGEHKKFPIVFWKSLYTTVDTALLNLSMKLLIKLMMKLYFRCMTI